MNNLINLLSGFTVYIVVNFLTFWGFQRGNPDKEFLTILGYSSIILVPSTILLAFVIYMTIKLGGKSNG